jgi:hypothetical protein
LTLTRSRDGAPAAAVLPPAVQWRKIATVASMATALTGLVLLTWGRPIPWNPGKVLIDTRGSFNMEAIRWGAYGREVPQGASLATLPNVLGAYGFETATSDTLINAAALEGTDVLVVMNPDTAFTDAEHKTIWDFVNRGGGLLVLGDHTNIMGVMEPFNTLLEPAGISLNFDSVIPKVDRWSWYGCMRFHPHPVTRRLRDEAELKLSVGASLTLDERAVPLLSGRDAFSDAGDWDNAQGAYLGNMAFDRHQDFHLPRHARRCFGWATGAHCWRDNTTRRRWYSAWAKPAPTRGTGLVRQPGLDLAYGSGKPGDRCPAPGSGR